MRHDAMALRSSILSGILPFVVTGCYMPIGSERQPTEQVAAEPLESKAVTTPDAVFAAPLDTGDGPVSQLTINGEQLEAADIWKGHKVELAERAAELTRSGYQSFVAQRAADLLRESVSESLLYQSAALRLTPEMETKLASYVDEDLRRIITTEYGGRQRRYERGLEEQGQTMDDVRAKLRRETIIRAYLEQEIKPRLAEPTRDVLFETYEKIAAKANAPKKRRMSLIDVRSNGTLPEAKEAARSRIESAEKKLQNGAPFEEVAKETSDGLHAVDGGAWGWISRNSVRERFEPAVAKLYQMEVGEVSSIVETSNGYFMVRCDEIETSEIPDFESLQPDLVKRHFEFSYRDAISNLVEDLRGKARINPPDLGRFHAGVVAAAPHYDEIGPPSP